MRYKDFKQPLTEAFKGREYNHLEDLVTVKGSKGALEAADILDGMGSDSGDVAIKWDGNPTFYWGREPDGTFVCVGKNGWGRQKSKTSDDLSKFILGTGKGEDWRKDFAGDMASVFELMKSATPPNFRGYAYGDLLYTPRKPYTSTDDAVEFTPNKVKYTVTKKSELGQRIAASQVGVVAHTTYDSFGSKDSTPIKDVTSFNNGDVVVLGQTYVTHQPKVDTKQTDAIRKKASAGAQVIDNFLAGTKGLSSPANIIYTYVNHMTRTQQLKNIESGFFDWVATSKLSKGQQATLASMNEANPKGLPAILGLIKTIMIAKDNIIDQLDSADADVKATTGGERGGEGYVAQKSKIKLVPRTRWQPN
jgi:hypothetical protein